MNQKFIEGLSDDLNISVALTALFEMIKKANILISTGEIFKKDAAELISALNSLDNILGVLPKKSGKVLPSKIIKKIEERQNARKEKNFKLADKIRDELLQKGIVLEDTKDGIRWKIKN